MAIVTKAIGTTSRDYSTITLWEAALGGAAGGSGNDAVGECYNDSVFDEAVTINDLTPDSITLSVASGERHDGTAGTGARIVRTADSIVFEPLYDADLAPLIIEWLEIDQNGQSGVAIRPNDDSVTGKANQIFRNNIIHGTLSNSGAEAYAVNSKGACTIINNLMYDIAGGGGDTQAAGGITASSNRDVEASNNTVHGLHHNRTNEYCTGINVPNRAGSIKKNNLVTAVTAATSSLQFCFSTTTTAVCDNNASEDETADDDEDTASSSLINIVPSSIYASTTEGAEDFLLLASGSDAIGAGADLGTSNGVNVDILGRDRDAEGDTWDIGAHQFVASGGGGVTIPIMIHHFKNAGGL